MTTPDHPDSTNPTARDHLANSLFRFYKLVLSPVLHAGALSQCRYLPTCSDYAHAAVLRHGWRKGTWLALRRLTRCHPFAKGGLDPVP